MACPLDEAAPIIAAVGLGAGLCASARVVTPRCQARQHLVGRSRRAGAAGFLADFGIARRIDDAAGLTATNMTVGTANYAAPEQLRGEAIDGRADQYALACTAFHMLTGAPPYEDSNPAVVISQHVNAPPPSIGARRPELAGLDPVFAAAMAKAPSGRFRSCEEFAQRLGHPGQDFGYAGAIPFPDTPPTLRAAPPAVDATVPRWPASAPPPVQRRRSRVLIGALVGVALLITAGVVAVVKLSQPDHPNHPGASRSTQRQHQHQHRPGTQHGSVDRHVLGQFRPGHQTQRRPGSGSQAVDGHVCVPFGVRKRRVRGDRRTPERRDGTRGERGVRPGRRTWVSVTTAPGKCNGQTGEAWEVFTLEPRPDGTLAGEYRGADVHACAEKDP